MSGIQIRRGVLLDIFENEFLRNLDQTLRTGSLAPETHHYNVESSKAWVLRADFNVLVGILGAQVDMRQ